MSYLVSAMLIIVAIIHLMPAIGALGNDRLSKLYGITIGDPNTSILMRHRAILFGIFGAFLAFAAFMPAFQTAAFVGGFVSVISFLWLARSVRSHNQQVRRVVTADLIALAALVLGAAAHVYLQIRG